VPLGAWLTHERGRGELVDVFSECAGGDGQAIGHAASAIGIPDRAAIEKSVAEPRAVRQQVANPDLASGRLARGALRHALVLERRNVFGDRVGEQQLPVFVQHHDGHAGDGLGHRGDAENRVGSHRLLALDVLEADGVHIRDLAFARDQRDEPGRFATIDERLHRLMHSIQPLG
jgi:hypothetical protein